MPETEEVCCRCGRKATYRWTAEENSNRREYQVCGDCIRRISGMDLRGVLAVVASHLKNGLGK